MREPGKIKIWSGWAGFRYWFFCVYSTLFLTNPKLFLALGVVTFTAWTTISAGIVLAPPDNEIQVGWCLVWSWCWLRPKLCNIPWAGINYSPHMSVLFYILITITWCLIFVLFIFIYWFGRIGVQCSTTNIFKILLTQFQCQNMIRLVSPQGQLLWGIFYKACGENRTLVDCRGLG